VIVAPGQLSDQLLAHTGQQPWSLFDVSIHVKLWHWAAILILTSIGRIVLATWADGRNEARERRAR
jgi:hypothetical protein